jgi:hypothetical protein
MSVTHSNAQLQPQMRAAPILLRDHRTNLDMHQLTQHGPKVAQHIVPTRTPRVTFGHPPLLDHLSPRATPWKTVGAAPQPPWSAPAFSARLRKRATAPSSHLSGHRQEATCRPPPRRPPPPRDRRASILQNLVTASGLENRTDFSRAGTIFFRYGMTMRMLEPFLRSRLSFF